MGYYFITYLYFKVLSFNLDNFMVISGNEVCLCSFRFLFCPEVWGKATHSLLLSYLFFTNYWLLKLLIFTAMYQMLSINWYCFYLLHLLDFCSMKIKIATSFLFLCFLCTSIHFSFSAMGNYIKSLCGRQTEQGLVFFNDPVKEENNMAA